MSLSSRKDEGVMIVTQNNEAGSLTIAGANQHLCALLGYDVMPEGIALQDILAKTTANLLKEEIEYEGDARDLAEVLSKFHKIVLQHQDGTDIPVEFTIIRTVAQDRNHMFRLVVSRETLREEQKTLARTLSQGFKEQAKLDDTTGLPNQETMRKNIQLAESLLEGKDVDACFVYLRLEDDDEMLASGKANIDEVLRHVGSVVQRNLRSDDTIGRIDRDALGIILVDVNKETVHLALARIPHMVAHDPLVLPGMEAYIPKLRQSCVLLDDMPPDDVVTICQRLLDEDSERDMVMFRGEAFEPTMFAQSGS